MPYEQEPQSPEILKAIQAAERKVNRMCRSAEQEAAGMLERARAQAERLLDEKRRSLDETRKAMLAQENKEAEREAERIVLEARGRADDLKVRCMAKLDEAAELALRYILPTERSAVSSRRSGGNPEAES